VSDISAVVFLFHFWYFLVCTVFKIRIRVLTAAVGRVYRTRIVVTHIGSTATHGIHVLPYECHVVYPVGCGIHVWQTVVLDHVSMTLFDF
jgi:hypothetical protein